MIRIIGTLAGDYPSDEPVVRSDYMNNWIYTYHQPILHLLKEMIDTPNDIAKAQARLWLKFNDAGGGCPFELKKSLSECEKRGKLIE